MSFESDPERDERGLVISVGQDLAGNWLVQDSSRKLEGRFISRSAALTFARDERDIYHARLEDAVALMVPLVCLAPVSADDGILPRAA